MLVKILIIVIFWANALIFLDVTFLKNKLYAFLRSSSILKSLFYSLFVLDPIHFASITPIISLVTMYNSSFSLILIMKDKKDKGNGMAC